MAYVAVNVRAICADTLIENDVRQSVFRSVAIRGIFKHLVDMFVLSVCPVIMSVCCQVGFQVFFNNPCTCKVVKSSSQPFIQFFWRLVLLQYLSHIVQLFMSIFVVVKQTKSHNQTPNWNFWLCTVIYLHLWCHNITSGFTKHYTSSILYLNLSNRFTGTWWFSEFTGKNLSSLHRCTTQCNPEYHKWTWWRSIYLLRLSC